MVDPNSDVIVMVMRADDTPDPMPDHMTNSTNAHSLPKLKISFSFVLPSRSCEDLSRRKGFIKMRINRMNSGNGLSVKQGLTGVQKRTEETVKEKRQANEHWSNR
jgi:hypothetical protein